MNPTRYVLAGLGVWLAMCALFVWQVNSFRFVERVHRLGPPGTVWLKLTPDGAPPAKQIETLARATSQSAGRAGAAPSMVGDGFRDAPGVAGAMGQFTPLALPPPLLGAPTSDETPYSYLRTIQRKVVDAFIQERAVHLVADLGGSATMKISFRIDSSGRISRVEAGGDPGKAIAPHLVTAIIARLDPLPPPPPGLAQPVQVELGETANLSHAPRAEVTRE